MLFSFKMAWAYFSKIWARGIWGVLVIISTMGVALGVASLVITLSVMNGFHSEITSKLLSLNPHIIIMNPFLGLEIEDKIKDNLNEIEGLKSAATFIFGKGLLHHKGSSHGVVVKGMDKDSAQVKLSEGDWNDMKGDGVVVGHELAKILKLDYGDDLYLIIPKIEQIGAPVIPKVEKLKLTGIFNSGIYEYDSTLAFVNIEQAKKIFADMSVSSGIELYLKDPFAADRTADYLQKKFSGLYYSVQTWKERNYNLFAALKLEKTMMFIILVMIVIVATFNIAGTLIMISVTRAKDCGVMRAIGATKRQIRLLFNFKGLLIGFTGAILGTLTGVLLSVILKKYQFIKLPPKIYLISTMPVRIDMADIAYVSITALIISYLATLYPAYRAGKLQIAEELRNE